jgi:hypothetical protein
LAVKASDHRGQKFVVLNIFQAQWVSGAQRDEEKERQLAAAIPFPKWVNGIQFGKEVGGGHSECIRRTSRKEVGRPQAREESLHLVVDEMRLAEQIAAL